jgi:hypothetical protein
MFAMLMYWPFVNPRMGAEVVTVAVPPPVDDQHAAVILLVGVA